MAKCQHGAVLGPGWLKFELKERFPASAGRWADVWIDGVVEDITTAVQPDVIDLEPIKEEV